MLNYFSFILDTTTNVLPLEIKSDRYKTKTFVRKCKRIYYQVNKLMKVIYVTEKSTKRGGQFVILVLGQNMLHTTTNLTLYRVLSYSESSRTI